MPALEQASVASGDENDWQEHGVCTPSCMFYTLAGASLCSADIIHWKCLTFVQESNIEDELAPGKLEPRAFNRPGQSRPAPGLRRDPITEQVKQVRA